MITLAPYGFYWFQLQERDKSERVAPSVVPEFETLVVPLGATWVSLARTRGVFERDVLPGHLARTRWYPERSPKAIQPDADLGDPVLRHRRQPALACLLRSDAARRRRRATCCRCRSNGCASIASAIIPARLPRCARARAKARCWMSRPTTIFIALLLRNLRENLTVEENGLRLEFRPTSKFSDKPVTAARARPRRRNRTVQQHGAGRQRLCGQGLSQARSRHQSRDRDRPVPDRGRGLRQYAGAARQRRTGRRRRAAARSRSFMPSSKTRATPGP